MKPKPQDDIISKLQALDPDFLKQIVSQALQEVLEAEMSNALSATKSQRSSQRLGYRSGYRQRSLITRLGKIELRVPRDRQGLFSTELFDRYQRSEKALVLSLMEMYIQGVATRRIKKITEELCGHEFSASAVSRLNKKLDKQLTCFHQRTLQDAYPYLILDARYERIRENSIVRKRAVLVAIGINKEGHRCILGVDLAYRESDSSWSTFLKGLKERGLHGVEFVVSDCHEGLRRSISKILPEASWQRCYVHFLRNASDHLPRKRDDDCVLELRWVYDRRNLGEARKDLGVWLEKWGDKYPKLCDWVEDSIEETLTFFSLPREHRKHMRSTNLLERFNEEIKRRTHLVRSFPNPESCLRLVRALGVEQHEVWVEGSRYLNMKLLEEWKKQELRKEKKTSA